MIESLNHQNLIALAKLVAHFPDVEGNNSFNLNIFDVNRRLGAIHDSEKPFSSYFSLEDGNYIFSVPEEALEGVDVKLKQDIDYIKAEGNDTLNGIRINLRYLLLDDAGLKDNDNDLASSLLYRLSPENVPEICSYLESVLDEDELFFVYSNLLSEIKKKNNIDESKLKSSLQLLAFYLRSDSGNPCVSCAALLEALRKLNLPSDKNQIAFDVLNRACVFKYNTNFIEGNKGLFLDFLDKVTEEQKSRLKNQEIKDCLLSLKRDVDYSDASLPEAVQVEAYDNDINNFSENEPLLPGEPKNNALTTKHTAFSNFIFAAQAFYAVVAPVVFCLSLYFVAFDFALILNYLSASAIFLATASSFATKDASEDFKSSSMLVYSALVFEAVKYSSFLVFLLGGGPLVSAGVYTGISLLMLVSFSIFFGSKDGPKYNITGDYVPNPVLGASGGMAIDPKLRGLGPNTNFDNQPTF